MNWTVMQDKKSPLGPIAGWTYLLVAFLGVSLICGIYWSISGTGSVMGFGNIGICVDEPGGSSLNQHFLPHDVRAGVNISGLGYSYCTSTPDLTQRIWYMLTKFPSTIMFIAVLVLLLRLIQGATRQGIYTTATARRLRILGWLLIAGSILAEFAEQAAKARLLAAMVNDHIGGYFMPGRPWGFAPMVLVGVGVLTFSRIVRVGCDMRADLDGTV